MESIYSATNTTTTTVVNPVAFDLITPLTGLFSSSGSFGGVMDFLSSAWTVYAIFAYLVVIGMMFLYVYASTGYKQLFLLQLNNVRQRERIYDEHFRSGPKNSRFADIQKHIGSDNPNDWKLAIIEADIILDEALKKMGYGGTSLGERLRSISPNQLSTLDIAWQAHKIRNQIAHGGADFVLTHKMAEDTIKHYRQVFTELGVA